MEGIMSIPHLFAYCDHILKVVNNLTPEEKATLAELARTVLRQGINTKTTWEQ